LRYRHISSYITSDGARTLLVTEHEGWNDVDNRSVSQAEFGTAIDFNFAIDNLNNKRYWEDARTISLSRLENEPVDGIARVHRHPGFPIGLTLGMNISFPENR
jgi:hypothetical protein